MSIYVPGKMVLQQAYVGLDDPDAAAYITAVEAADQTASPDIGALETATKVAIHSFVKGCKADGIWSAIKASCILAGARTLNGALVPLVGAAPTNNNFVSSDYNRKTGLVGDGSTKHLNSNRNTNADPQNNCHIAVYATTARTNQSVYIGGESLNRNTIIAFNNVIEIGGLRSNAVISSSIASTATGLIGASRTSSTNVNWRASQTSGSASNTSTTPDNINIFVFCRNVNNSANLRTNARLSFYSIGEALDLALLDSRVTALMTDLAAAIP